jgi:hypothetical protein
VITVTTSEMELVCLGCDRLHKPWRAEQIRAAVVEWLRSTPSNELSLPPSLLLELDAAGFRSVADLADASDEQLLAVPGLAAGRLEQIRQGIRLVRQLLLADRFCAWEREAGP